MMRGHRKVIGGLAIEGGDQPLFGSHRFHGQEMRSVCDSAELILRRLRFITVA